MDHLLNGDGGRADALHAVESKSDPEAVGLLKASVVMQRLSHPTEIVIYNKIARNIIVLSF